MRQHILDSHISPRQPVVWPGRFPIKIQTCAHYTPSEEARALQIRSFKFQAYFQFEHHWQNIGTLGLLPHLSISPSFSPQCQQNTYPFLKKKIVDYTKSHLSLAPPLPTPHNWRQTWNRLFASKTVSVSGRIHVFHLVPWSLILRFTNRYIGSRTANSSISTRQGKIAWTEKIT